jgi:hypothetical protein
MLLTFLLASVFSTSIRRSASLKPIKSLESPYKDAYELFDDILPGLKKSLISSKFQNTDKMTHPEVKESFLSFLNPTQIKYYEMHRNQFTPEVMRDFVKRVEGIRNNQINDINKIKKVFRSLERDLAALPPYRILQKTHLPTLNSSDVYFFIRRLMELPDMPDKNILKYEKNVMDECWKSYIKLYKTLLEKAEKTTESDITHFLSGLAISIANKKYSEVAHLDQIAVNVDDEESNKNFVDALKQDFTGSNNTDLNLQMTTMFRSSKQFKEFVYSEFKKLVQFVINQKLKVLCEFVTKLYKDIQKLPVRRAKIGEIGHLEDALAIVEHLKGMRFSVAERETLSEVFEAAKKDVNIKALLIDGWNRYARIELARLAKTTH